MDRGEISDSTFKAIMNVGAAATVYLSFLFGRTIDGTKEIALETIDTTSDIISKSIETTSDMFSKITQYTGLSSVYSLLVKIVELITKVPE